MLEAKLIAKTSIPQPAPETPIQDLREPEMYFTAGQIFRGKLMLTNKGTPQRSRMKVNAIVNKLATAEMETPWGMSKAISAKQLNDFNNRMVRLTEAKLAYEDFMEHGEIIYHPRIYPTLTPVKNLSTITPQPTIDQSVEP
jgi:hypothetical protein